MQSVALRCSHPERVVVAIVRPGLLSASRSSTRMIADARDGKDRGRRRASTCRSLRSAEALRRLGFAGELTLVGAEQYFPPYDRPPLSKEMLRGDWGADRGQLRVAEGLEVELRLGVTATGLDLEHREVHA